MGGRVEEGRPLCITRRPYPSGSSRLASGSDRVSHVTIHRTYLFSFVLLLLSRALVQRPVTTWRRTQKADLLFAFAVVGFDNQLGGIILVSSCHRGGLRQIPSEDHGSPPVASTGIARMPSRLADSARGASAYVERHATWSR